MASSPFSRSFYHRPTLIVARELIGARLVRVEQGRRLAGLITETEAYIGQEDLACHARAGKTPRTAPMFGAPGHAYVYFTYGCHWLLNVVTEAEGSPAAVLIRAIFPTEGQEIITQRRNGRDTFGPGKICQAMAIGKAENELDMTRIASGLWIEPGVAIADEKVVTTPRIGIDSTPEPWKSIPWRYWVKDWKIEPQ